MPGAMAGRHALPQNVPRKRQPPGFLAFHRDIVFSLCSDLSRASRLRAFVVLRFVDRSPVVIRRQRAVFSCVVSGFSRTALNAAAGSVCRLQPEPTLRAANAASRLPSAVQLGAHLRLAAASIASSPHRSMVLPTLRYGQRPLHEHGCLADGAGGRMVRRTSASLIAFHRAIEFALYAFAVFASSGLRGPAFVVRSSW